MRLRPEGHYQCTGCRAAFASESRALGSSFKCPGVPLAHGHPYEREHVLYPYSYNRGDGYGPDRLCDEVGCSVCVGHTCDCDVCTERIEVPALKVLNDSREHGNTKRSPNWEVEEQMEDLMAMLATVKPGDYVTAFGKDTRGHEVTRVGTLLAEPKEMKATHNGVKVAAIRACVGEKGTDPATRQTWTTLIPDHGFIRKTERPKPGEWTHGEIRNIPAVRSSRLDVNARLLFGGKGGKRTKEPTDTGTLAEITYVGSGRYEVKAVDSGEVIFTGSLQSQVWWSYAPEEDEHQDQEPEADEHGQEQDDDEPENVTELVFGKPVHHLDTGELVGYWTLEKFTPIEEIRQ
ncbi:hypothetical protein SEA_SUCCESS_73 [Streptomyces phage Success]|uniref:Uncharacterized protein n=1 Tax=Streptomyces phage Success TaxID=2999013 RepID=A0A9E8S0A8_9CAUD|nr:hypothetical protein QEH47_gp59 [Streptomyces phage Success]WAB08852.1 hypothetical protein SEA_SUCCESS_73 [Streptomyces phage Success]